MGKEKLDRGKEKGKRMTKGEMMSQTEATPQPRRATASTTKVLR